MSRDHPRLLAKRLQARVRSPQVCDATSWRLYSSVTLRRYTGKYRKEQTHHNLHPRIRPPHTPHQRPKRLDNIRHRLILLHNIIRTQMHRNHVRGICLQPPIQLPFIRNVDSEETRVAFVVAVVGRVRAVVFGFAAADKVYGGGVEGRGLEALPELGAPADYLGYGVAEGHVADWGVGDLGGCEREEGGEGEEGGEQHRGGCDAVELCVDLREAVFMLWLHVGVGDKWLAVLCRLDGIDLATSHLSHCMRSLTIYEHHA